MNTGMGSTPCRIKAATLLLLAFLLPVCACTKPSATKKTPSRSRGTDQFANNLILWSVGGEYREVMYTAERGKTKPLPDIWLQFEDGGIAHLPEITEDFLSQRKLVTHYTMVEKRELYRFPGADFSFVDHKLVSMGISVARPVSIGPSRDGPFLKMGGDEEMFWEVFGKPVNHADMKD